MISLRLTFPQARRTGVRLVSLESPKGGYCFVLREGRGRIFAIFEIPPGGKKSEKNRGFCAQSLCVEGIDQGCLQVSGVYKNQTTSQHSMTFFKAQTMEARISVHGVQEYTISSKTKFLYAVDLIFEGRLENVTINYVLATFSIIVSFRKEMYCNLPKFYRKLKNCKFAKITEK